VLFVSRSGDLFFLLVDTIGRRPELDRVWDSAPAIFRSVLLPDLVLGRRCPVQLGECARGQIFPTCGQALQSTCADFRSSASACSQFSPVAPAPIYIRVTMSMPEPIGARCF
jgi:hypothetical protein